MEYYYVYKGEKKGPFSLTEIYKKDIKEDTLIWYEGLNDWTKAIEISELKVMFKVDSPPIPPPPVPESHLTKEQKFERIAEKVLPKKSENERKTPLQPTEKPKISILSKYPLFVVINIIPLYLFFFFFYYPESEIYDPNSFGVGQFLGANFVLFFSLLIGLFKQIEKQTWIIIIVIQWVISLLVSLKDEIINYIL